MAEAAVVATITKTVEISANFIAEEGSRLDVPQKMRWLEGEMRHMQAYIDVAEAMRVTNPQVATFVKDIRDLAQDTEDILDSFVPEIESHRSRGIIKKTANIFSYGRTCSKFAREIEKIERRVQAVHASRETYKIPHNIDAGSDRVNVDPRDDALHVDEPVVVGRDAEIDDLKMKLLREEKELFVAIVGMAGLGKTTLAKKVFKGVKDRFDCSASVSVSQQPNVRDILKNIAKQVGLGETENLEADLYAYLQEKRYVLLLDDIWHTEAWAGLKVGFPINRGNGGRIIVTSRDTGVGRNICRESPVHHLHPLNPLDSPTSWNLFCKLIMSSLTETIEEFEHSELGETGKKLVERCGGVPLAIVVTVGMLRARETTEIEWKEVLKSIRQDNHDKCSQILALSYRDLSSALKPCFLYLGLFPEDTEISVSDLIRMWMAERLIEGRRGFEPEDVGEDYMKKLVARNLVQVVSRKHNGKINRIRIHDLLHSMCVNVAEEINFFHTTLDNSKHDSVARVRRFVDCGGSTDADITYRHLDLRTLLRFRTHHWRGKISIGNNKRLRVLRTSGIHYNRGSIELVTSIYLNYLRSDSRISGRSMKNFKYLQSLDLREASVTGIPAAVWRMKQLRHLLLGFSVRRPMFGSRPRKVSLPNLQTLVGIPSTEIAFLGTNSFPNLRKFEVLQVTDDIVKKLCKLEPISVKIETLGLLVGAPRETLDLSKYNNLTKLSMPGLRLKQLPQINQFPPNLLKLTLVGSNLEEDPMQILKELPKLKILKLGVRCYVGRRLDCSGADSFPQLEVLHLFGLENLEEVTDGDERGMHELREVKINSCPRLRRIPEWLERVRTTD